MSYLKYILMIVIISVILTLLTNWLGFELIIHAIISVLLAREIRRDIENE